MAKSFLFGETQGGADTRVGFYVCKCAMLFIKGVSDVMPRVETLIAWHFIVFNVSLHSGDTSRQKCRGLKALGSLKVNDVGFFLLWGKLLNINCPIGFWRKKVICDGLYLSFKLRHAHWPQNCIYYLRVLLNPLVAPYVD